MKKYFNQCKTKQEAKALFRQLVLTNHPDVGGSEEVMTAIILEYKPVYASLPNATDYDPKKQTFTKYDDDADFTMTQAMVNVVNQINHLPEIEIELVGVWLWIGGNTKPVKEILKKAGFAWHSKKSLWYWKEAETEKGKGKRRSNVDMEVIRTVYGSEKVEKVTYEKIAQ